MSQAISYDGLVKMLLAAASQIETNKDELSKLDSFGGDGDHGTTMSRAMKNLKETIEKNNGSNDIKTLLYDVGWAIMGVDGGATGPLFGTFFMGMSEPAEGKELLEVSTLAQMLRDGLANVQKQTKAKVGDKTIIDAMVPAVEAATAAANENADLHEFLSQTAKAAEQGAASTSKLQARFGRAKNIGEKSIGNPDPGATSVSLMFKGFLEGN
jgi:dihydroxyacetone kinase-like protein